MTVSGGPSTTTNASGDYTICGLAPATHSVTASKSGYTTSSPASVAVTAGNPTTQNFALVPVAGPTTTAFFYASAATAGPGGDGNGYETGGPNILGAPDTIVATDASSGSGKSTNCTSTARDSEIASYTPPSTSGTILGIQVRVTGRASAAQNGPRYCVQLSWNGGTSWTAGKTTGNLTTSLATYSLGTTSDTWGHTWTPTELSAANFRVRVIDLASSTIRTFYLDAVGVSITYQ